MTFISGDEVLTYSLENVWDRNWSTIYINVQKNTLLAIFALKEWFLFSTTALSSVLIFENEHHLQSQDEFCVEFPPML